MNGYKLKLVQTEEDLKDVKMDFLLKSYDLEDCIGIYYDDCEATFDPSKMSKQNVLLGTVVHGRLYVEDAKVWVDNNGVFITDEEFEQHF